MIVLVTDGRNYPDRDHVFAVLDAIHAATPISLIVHGACGIDYADEDWSPTRMTGADRWAEMWAQTRRCMAGRCVPSKAFAADWSHWKQLGRAGWAGPERNCVMTRFVASRLGPKLGVGFPGQRGTADCLAQARARQLPVRACCEGHPLVGSRL